MKPCRILCVAITLLCYVNAATKTGEDADISNSSQDIDSDEKVSIIGGRRAEIKDYPYTASVIVETGHQGSAVIINRRWLLTTGWVTLYEIPKAILVRTGSNSAIIKGQTRWVEKVITHPSYKADWPYDLALIKLKKPLRFHRHVKPIKIADSTPRDDDVAKLTGFGFTNSSKQYSYVHDGWLRESSPKIISYEKCKEYYSGNPSLTEMSFCTSVTTTEGPCWFDFGSPVVYKRRLVGVYSGAPTCGDPSFPSVHTDVTKLKSWIIDTIRHNSEPGEIVEL